MNPLRPSAPARRAGRRGQTLIFLLMVMVILTFVMFSVYDTQHVIVQRVRSQNGSDATALTGAQWQLSSLNALGEINLLKVTTEIVTVGVPPFGSTYPQYDQYRPVFSALDKLQAKICFMWPLWGVLYAQQAAKLNGMHNVEDYARTFYETADYVRNHVNDYPQYVYDPWLQFFTDDERRELLSEYANQLYRIADAGVAALPTNAWGDEGDLDFSNASPYAGPYLANRRFYSAIAARDWCWLRPILFIYTDWTFWGPVGASRGFSPFRFLRLGVVPQPEAVVWNNLGINQDDLVTLVRNHVEQPPRGASLNPNWPGGPWNGGNWPLHGFTYTNDFPRFDIPSAPAYVPLWWAVYDGRWGSWPSDPPSGQGLKLLISDIKQKFDYSGADSTWIVQASANVLMSPSTVYDQQAHRWRDQPENLDKVSWTAEGQQAGLREAFNDLASIKRQASSSGRGIVGSAAAKAFGSIDDNTPPQRYRVVLPVFTDVRLIPLAFSSAGSDFDPLWLEHKFGHLPSYTRIGLSGLAGGCTFCDQLRIWENPAFRAIGQDWLSRNTCPPGGGGGGGGGGPVH